MCARVLSLNPLLHVYYRLLTLHTRVCRDWSRVEKIARENSACFKDLGAARARKSNIEEWLHCPIDSPYQEKVNEYIANRRDAI
jgi:hypothetical protein